MVYVQAKLASFMGTEECILYSYDLATVPSVIPAFANAKDIIVCDQVLPWSTASGPGQSSSCTGCMYCCQSVGLTSAAFAVSMQEQILHIRSRQPGQSPPSSPDALCSSCPAGWAREKAVRSMPFGSLSCMLISHIPSSVVCALGADVVG